MDQQSLVSAVTNLAAPLIESLNLSLWGVEVCLGPRSIVRVYLEGSGEFGATIDECAELSRLLGLSLEVEDIIPGAYSLEVSSPGLERVYFNSLQLSKDIGSNIEVRLNVPNSDFPGRHKFKGCLIKQEGELFFLEIFDNKKVLKFTFDSVKKVHKIHSWEDSDKVVQLDNQKKVLKKKPKKLEKEVSIIEDISSLNLTDEEKSLYEITGGSEAL